MLYIKIGFSIVLFLTIFLGAVPTIMDEGIDITSIFVLIILIILLFILLKSTYYDFKNPEKAKLRRIKNKEIFSKEDKQNKIQNQSTHTASRQNRTLNQLNKDRAIQSIQTHAQNFNRILTDVQCGYKNLDPYLSRYRILLEAYADMEKLNNDFNLNALPYNSKTLYDTFSSELLKFIKSKILIVLDKHSIDDDNNKALLKDLKKVRNDIIEGKHEYPEFADLLQEIQFQIEEQIKKLS